MKFEDKIRGYNPFNNDTSGMCRTETIFCKNQWVQYGRYALPKEIVKHLYDGTHVHIDITRVRNNLIKSERIEYLDEFGETKYRENHPIPDKPIIEIYTKLEDLFNIYNLYDRSDMDNTCLYSYADSITKEHVNDRSLDMYLVSWMIFPKPGYIGEQKLISHGVIPSSEDLQWSI